MFGRASWKVEYLYTDFGDGDVGGDMAIPPCAAQPSYFAKTDIELQTLRAGLNWRF